MVKEHGQAVLIAMGAIDLLVTAGTWMLCYAVRFHSGWFGFQETSPPGLHYIADVMLVTLLVTLLVFTRLGLYQPRRMQSPGTEMFHILRACAIVWGIEVVISHFMHQTPVSRTLQVMFLAVWTTAMMAYRGTTRVLLRAARRRGRNIRRVAIIGAGRLGQKLLHALRGERWMGYEVAYFIEDMPDDHRIRGVPVRGPIAQADRIVEAAPVDAVLVALPHRRADQLADVLNRLSSALVDVNVVPDLLSTQFLRHRVYQLGGLPVVNLTHSEQTGWNAVTKRIFDIAMSTAAILALSWLLLLIGLAVKLTSRGRVFYRQRRTSLGGKEFDIIKFRSMVPNAEADNGPVWSAMNDPRVTPVGRILRRFSLDELPQLFNVLAGDMSLVGPRPERPELIERFSQSVPGYMLRHHVKAGITGWAQVNGYRGMTSLRKRIQYDLDYINRWSLGFDLYILFRTAVRGFFNPQA